MRKVLEKLRSWRNKVAVASVAAVGMVSTASAQYTGDYVESVTALSDLQTDVLAVGAAGMVIFVLVRGFHWAKGAIS